MNQFTASLWGDEGFAAILAQKPIFEIISTVARDTSPPLFYLTLHIWMRIFGTSEVAIRALSFLYFILLVFTVFLIGKLLWNKKTGLLAAFLTFVNPFLFHYGFEGRMYSILAFFSTLSMYFYLKKSLWGYVLATSAALYSHHFAIFVVFSQGLWSLKKVLFVKKKLFKELKPFLLTGLLYLPWLYPLYYQTSLVAGDFWLATPKIKDVVNLLETFILGGTGPRYEKILLLILLFIIFMRRFSLKKKVMSQDLFLFNWAFLPIILTFIISQFTSSIFFDSYLLLCIPPILLFLASRRRKIGTILILLIAFYFLYLDFNYFTHPTKRPFKELAQYVHKTKKIDDKFINFNDKAHHIWETKYYKIPAPLYVPEGELPFYVGTALMEENDIIKKLPKTKRLGVITSGDPQNVSLPGFRLQEKHEFGELKFLWLIKI